MLGMGVFIGQSTKIYDRATGDDHATAACPPARSSSPAACPSADGCQPLLRGDRQAGRREDPREDQHQRAAARLMPMSVNSRRREDIAGMRVAGRLAAELLDYLTPHVQPGITTGEIDHLAHDYRSTCRHGHPGDAQLRAAGALARTRRRCARRSTTSSATASPGDKKLKAGDIVNIDVTVIKDGFHGDTSRMFYVGTPSIQARRLVDTTYEAMWRGIRAVRPARTSATSAQAIQQFAEATASRSCASSAATASGASSTRSRRCSTTAAPAPAQAAARDDLHHRADDQRRPAGDPLPRRRLDDRHRRPLAVGAVGAHGAGDAGGLRGADGLRRARRRRRRPEPPHATRPAADAPRPARRCPAAPARARDAS